MGRVYAATLANFFLPGLGYIINAGDRMMLGPIWLIGVLGLTYVEFGIQEPQPHFYMVMFASVLIMNTAFAIDAFREGKALHGDAAPTAA